MRKVVVLSKEPETFGYEIETFKQFDDVEFIISPAILEDDVIEVIKDAEVVLFTSTRMNERVINSLEKCKLIIRYGVGYDNVDLVAAAKRGIFVCNAPNYGVVDVAEHALSLILATAKKTVNMHERAHEGLWGPGMPPFYRLAGKTIGFIGFGHIGRALCKMTNGLSMKPLVYDPYVSDEMIAEYGAVRMSVEQLLEASDFVSLHLPLNEGTRHFLGKELLTRMKKTAILINTSRGAIINEKELIDALENGVIAGAGLDVFEDETKPIDERLLASSRVVLTPHVAWNTDVAVTAIHEEVGDNVVRYLKGERPMSIVNKI